MKQVGASFKKQSGITHTRQYEIREVDMSPMTTPHSDTSFQQATPMVYPEPGRIVIFQGADRGYPAMITSLCSPEVGDHAVNLNVFTDEGVRVQHKVEFSIIPTAGTWAWPKGT